MFSGAVEGDEYYGCWGGGGGGDVRETDVFEGEGCVGGGKGRHFVCYCVGMT